LVLTDRQATYAALWDEAAQAREASLRKAQSVKLGVDSREVIHHRFGVAREYADFSRRLQAQAAQPQSRALFYQTADGGPIPNGGAIEEALIALLDELG
jgi:hypothetical protein